MVKYAAWVVLLASAAVGACGPTESTPFAVSVGEDAPKAARKKAKSVEENVPVPSASTVPGDAPPETKPPETKPPETKPPGTTPPAAEFPDIVFEMDTHIAPGSESQECLFVQIPGDRGLVAVPSAESHYSTGSHHFLAYRTGLTTLPAAYPGVVDCFETLGGAMSFSTGSYYEAQQPDQRHDLPPGVAHIFEPGEVVLLQTHYLNPGIEPKDAKVVLTLHTMDPDDVENEAGSILFSNFLLNIPAHAKVTQTRTCTVSNSVDMHLSLLWSHMHKQGVRFVATTDDPGVEGTLYESDDWNEPKAREFGNDPATIVHAGRHITFSCDFNNTTSSALSYGPSAETDEMCILHGMYWPRADRVTEACLLGSSR
jgi:hypothetical protein